MAKVVIHRNGQIEPFKTEKVINAIKDVLVDIKIDDPFVAMFKIIKNFETRLADEVRTEEIDGLILKAIEPLIPEDTIYDQIATRQLVKLISEDVNKRFSSFSEYIKFGVENKLLDPRMEEFDLGTLELNINYDNDKHLNYFGTSTLQHRYLIKDHSKNVLEKVQWMWMRIAMGLSILEPNKEEFALKIYNKLATLRYLHSTPTLFNSGTNFPQLISCFIGVIGDSIEDIMAKATDAAQYAKFAGGTAMSFTKLRASGSNIKSINSSSCGPIPFIKIFDTTVASVAIGGKRASNLVAYLEPWHYNIEEFLDLKETNGNESMRARKLNTALWIPDEFMERVMMNEDWYMFDPKETPELSSTWGPTFSQHYRNYAEKAEKGEMKMWKKTKAQELYREMLIRMAKTGNYWLNFKDRHNEKSQAPSYSLIHSTNMCTEISIPNREDSTATCTLASLNLSRFLLNDKLANVKQMSLEEKLECINWKDLVETTQIAIQALDNVVELNHYVSETSKKGSFDLRPLGLGVMGFGEMLLYLDIAYEHSDALAVSDKLGSTIYNAALEKSKELAKTRGTFADYDKDRYAYEPRRNILLLAIAPTATISNIAGTSSGIETFFSNVYARETISGKFTIVVKHLTERLKAQGLWSDDVRQKIMDAQGSVQHIGGIESALDKQVFKTVYECSPASQVDVAAVWQKYVDQAISRNIYVKEHERSSLFDIYMYAWKQGLKSTYYCFIEKNIQGEKYTENVNKRGNRLGFGAAAGGGEGEATAAATTRGFGGIRMAAATASESPVTVELGTIDFKNVTAEQKAAIESKMRAEK